MIDGAKQEKKNVSLFVSVVSITAVFVSVVSITAEPQKSMRKKKAELSGIMPRLGSRDMENLVT